jgi:hypothetical protein
VNGRFEISGDAGGVFSSFEAARRAAEAASRRQPGAVELMWCDDTGKPKVCIGCATAGEWLATDEGREWAFNVGFKSVRRMLWSGRE